ncbi:MAG: type VI secretion system tube protein Hcp [Lewinellaceae bacterium]|nr:type VI secretion system tube protein Hcp [Lewinellaceae bacterium]
MPVLSQRPAATPEAPAAAVDYFLKIEGIDGESTDDKHKQWIDIDSYSLNRAAQTVQIVRRTTSRSSAKIALFCARGSTSKKQCCMSEKVAGTI